MSEFGEIFGMSGKGNTGVVDGALLQWRRHQACEMTIEASVYSVPQPIEQSLRVSGVRSAALRLLGETLGNAKQLSGCSACLADIIDANFTDGDVNARHRTSGAQYLGVCNDNDIGRELSLA